MGGCRAAQVVKSPAAPNVAFAYAVTGLGIELLDGVSVPTPQQGNCTVAAITNEQEYNPQH
jgi:hypothetical protein